jgi:hypothetical protein
MPASLAYPMVNTECNGLYQGEWPRVRPGCCRSAQHRKLVRSEVRVMRRRLARHVLLAHGITVHRVRRCVGHWRAEGSLVRHQDRKRHARKKMTTGTAQNELA